MNRIEKQIGNHVVIHDNDQSGALLSWQFFHPGTEVPMFIHHIDDYDRWQFKLDGTKAFQKALWSYAPWSFADWKARYLNSVDLWSEQPVGSGLTSYIEQGKAILRAHEQNVQSVVKGSARKCVIPAMNIPTVWEAVLIGLAANCPPHLQSDVGHELANQSGTFGLLWYIDKDNVCRCSLRSNGDYDVSAIAKVFGGGGHRNAAGFTTDIQTLLDWIK